MLCCDSRYCVYIYDVWCMVVGINLPRVDLFLIVIARERLERPRDKTRARALFFIPAKQSRKREEKRERERFITRLYCNRALYRGENINPERVVRRAFILVGFTIRGALVLHGDVSLVYNRYNYHTQSVVVRISRRCVID